MYKLSSRTGRVINVLYSILRLYGEMNEKTELKSSKIVTCATCRAYLEVRNCNRTTTL